MKILKLTLTALLCTLLLNVSHAQLKCYTLKAPEKVIPEMKKIAIMNFNDRQQTTGGYWYTRTTTDYGSIITDKMVSLLLQEHRGVTSYGKNYLDRVKTNVYTVIERGQLDAIIKEQKLGASGAISDGDAASVGKLLGVDVIISGNFSVRVADKTTSKSSTNKETGKTTTTYTVTRTSVAESTMKIISIETGQILGMVDKSGSYSVKKTGSSAYSARQNLPANEAMKVSATKNLASNLVGYFTPVFVARTFKFEKTKVKDYKKKGKEAKKMAKAGDVDGAYGIVASIYEGDPYNAEMAYNTGILNEAVGNYDKAIELHSSAMQIRDDKRYKKALARAKSGKAALEQLKGLGVNVTPYAFATLSGNELEDAAEVDKVTTKGSKKDRIAAYSDPNVKSSVVAKVPGATDFTVIKREGSFVKVKLLGGKEGYFPAKSVK